MHRDQNVWLLPFPLGLYIYFSLLHSICSLNDVLLGQAFHEVKKMLLETCTFHMGCLVCVLTLLLIHLATNMHIGRQLGKTEVLGSMLPMWDTWTEFLSRGFSLMYLSNKMRISKIL